MVRKALGLAAALSVALTVIAVSAGGVGWARINTSGFGDPNNQTVSSLASFAGSLYAGTANYVQGAQIHVWAGQDWTRVADQGIGTSGNANINHLRVFKSWLYATTENEDGGQVWRSSNGVLWEQVVERGFGDPTNGEVFRLVEYNGRLYASTASYSASHGAEIWRSSSGARNDWTRVVANGFGDPHNNIVLAFEIFGGNLYAGTSSLVWSDYSSTGGEVWRSNNGTTWTQVNTDGFGAASNTSVSALQGFGGYLYASTVTSPGQGAQLWRCQACSGADWQQVVSDGLGNVNNRGMSALEVLNGYLYWVVGNSVTGMEVWRSQDGVQWEPCMIGGWNDAHNRAGYWDSSVALHQDRLYVGTWNPNAGGQVWLMLTQQMYLPIQRKRY